MTLPVTGVMHRVWIETLKLVGGEEDASLVAFDLCKKVLLLVVMCWCHIPCGETILIEKCDVPKTSSTTSEKEAQAFIMKEMS